MSVTHLKTLLFISLLGASGAGMAADDHQPLDAKADKATVIAHGEKAHQTHCYKCHTDQVYTRENRFVRSLDALSKQVVRCKENTATPWFDDDTEAVVQFLNSKYYKF